MPSLPIFTLLLAITLTALPPVINGVTLPIKVISSPTTSQVTYPSAAHVIQASRRNPPSFIVAVQLGTPPLSLNLALQASTPITWLQSSDCHRCFPMPSPTFNPNKSLTFQLLPQNAPLCSPPVAGPASSGEICLYDVGNSHGTLGVDIFQLPSSSLILPNFALGLGVINFVDFGDNTANVVGMLGLGHGHGTSLLQQLISANSTTEERFSYCLPPAALIEQNDDEKDGAAATLDFGAEAKITGQGIQSTPILKNPRNDRFSYYLNLTGVSVHGIPVLDIDYQRVFVPSGFVIDMGTLLTVMSEPTYNPLRKAVAHYFAQKFGVRPMASSKTKTGLDLCYKDGDFVTVKSFPKIEFIFQDGASLELSQVFHDFSELSETCLLILPTIGIGPSKLGALQQTTSRFSFDLGQSKLSFAHSRC